MRCYCLEINRGCVVGHTEVSKADIGNRDRLVARLHGPKAPRPRRSAPGCLIGTCAAEGNCLVVHLGGLGESPGGNHDCVAIRGTINRRLNRRILLRWNREFRTARRVDDGRCGDTHDRHCRCSHRSLRLRQCSVVDRRPAQSERALADRGTQERSARGRGVQNHTQNQRESKDIPPMRACARLRFNGKYSHESPPCRSRNLHPPHRASNPSSARSSAAISTSGVPSWSSSSRSVRRMRIDTMRVTVRPSSTVYPSGGQQSA